MRVLLAVLGSFRHSWGLLAVALQTLRLALQDTAVMLIFSHHLLQPIATWFRVMSAACSSVKFAVTLFTSRRGPIFL